MKGGKTNENNSRVKSWNEDKIYLSGSQTQMSLG